MPRLSTTRSRWEGIRRLREESRNWSGIRLTVSKNKWRNSEFERRSWMKLRKWRRRSRGSSRRRFTNWLKLLRREIRRTSTPLSWKTNRGWTSSTTCCWSWNAGRLKSLSLRKDYLSWRNSIGWLRMIDWAQSTWNRKLSTTQIS